MRDQIQRTKDNIIIVITNKEHVRYATTPQNNVNALEGIYIPPQGTYKTLTQIQKK